MKKRKGKQTKDRGNKYKTNNKTVDLNSNISITTLNINDKIIRNRLLEWIFLNDPIMCCW